MRKHNKSFRHTVAEQKSNIKFFKNEVLPYYSGNPYEPKKKRVGKAKPAGQGRKVFRYAKASMSKNP